MIEELIKKNESKTLEFKENLSSINGIIKTIVAFSNTAGGTIVVGIKDKTKDIVGISDVLMQEERLANAINDSIEPLLMPDIEIHTFRNKELIIINVAHGAGPFYIKSLGIENGTYIRFGSTNRIADKETLQTLKNYSENIYFDEIIVLNTSSQDLDWPIIKKLFLNIDKKISITNGLNLGILANHNNNEVATNGGLILFGKERLKKFPDAIIRCVRFLGTDRDEILDQATFDNYLPIAFDEVLKFITRHTNLSSDLKGLRRINTPQYPLRAIREIVMNAIVHADYAIKGVTINIVIFDDRIEITNPGALPFGITLEKALSGASRVRNRVIAKVFHALNWIEQWGRGFGIIIKECKKFGLGSPEFEELNNQFRVTLFAKLNDNAEIEPKNKEIIKYLKSKEKITTRQAADFWKVTTRTARTRLIRLIDEGLVSKVATSSKDPHGVYLLTSRHK